MQAFSILLAMLAAQPQPAPAAAATETNRSEDVRELEALNAAWLNSYVARDPSVLESILADDFVAVYGGGTRRTKAELVARVRNPTVEILSVVPENVQVQISGDVAVVTARSVLRVRTAEGESELRNDYADIYARRNGRWRGISAHIVRVAPATP